MMNRAMGVVTLAAAMSCVLGLKVRTAAAVECSNKFGDQMEVSGGAATEAAAKDELAKALKEALESAAKDCDEKTCKDEPKAKCRFVHTVTKPRCKPGPGVPAPAFICSQKYRPGCFCLKEDEQIELKAARDHE
jgi:hypothetical protein